MIQLFHEQSQNVFKRAPRVTRESGSSLVHISEMAGELKQFVRMSQDERRLYWLNIVQERRYLVSQQPRNHWFIYELCKVLNEVAEIDHVDFKAAGYAEKLNLIWYIVPFASHEALSEGVTEYHDTCKTSFHAIPVEKVGLNHGINAERSR